jgi:hypothetical protein
MNVDDVRERAATYDSLLAAGFALAYLVVVTVAGATLVGDPSSAASIVSDAVALALLAHAYARGALPELASALVAALILVGWALAATPATALVDAGVPAALRGDEAKPVGLAVVLIVSYALVLRGAVPSLRRWLE